MFEKALALSPTSKLAVSISRTPIAGPDKKRKPMPYDKAIALAFKDLE